MASRVQNTENNGFPNDKFYDFQNGKFLFNQWTFLLIQKRDLTDEVGNAPWNTKSNKRLNKIDLVFGMEKNYCQTAFYLQLKKQNQRTRDFSWTHSSNFSFNFVLKIPSSPRFYEYANDWLHVYNSQFTPATIKVNSKFKTSMASLKM